MHQPHLGLAPASTESKYEHKRSIQEGSVADTDPLDTDPDTAFHFYTDSDPPFPFDRIWI